MISITNTGSVGNIPKTVALQSVDKIPNAGNAQQVTETAETPSEIEKYAADLSNKYGVTFIYTDIKNKNQIASFAESCENRYSVAISQETLQSIMSDPQKRAEFENLLKNFKDLYMTGRYNDKAADKAGVIVSSFGEVSVWELEKKDPRDEKKQKAENIIKQMEEITRKTAEANKEANKKNKKTDENKFADLYKTKKNNFSPRSSMLKIARANSVQATKKVISSLYAQRYILGSQDMSTSEKAAVERTIETVIQKARVKIKGLEKERLSKVRIKKAEAQKQLKRAAMMAYALKKQRTGRKSKEYGEALTFYGPNGLIQYSRRNRPYDDDEQGEYMSDYIADTAIAAPMAVTAPQPAATPAGFMSVDVMSVPSGTLSVFTMPSIDVSV